MAQRLSAARRRRQLLDVAVDVFADSGFHATSVADVAEAAGVTKPVLYQHFPSKRELYRSLLEDVGVRLRTTIEAATSADLGPREQVEAGLAAFFDFVGAEPSAFLLLFGSGTRRDGEFADVAAATEAAIARVVAGRLGEAGLDDAERDLVAHGIVGLAEGTTRRWIATGCVVEPGELARLVSRLAWAGLRGLPPASGPSEPGER